ncbi:MAG: hypothetical protein ACPLSO_06000, partial [Fervidicoccaceae archaeon]
VNTNIQGTFTLSSTTTTTTTTTAFPIVVKMGADMWIIATVSGINSPGTYQVTVYTDAGNSYNQVVTAYS